MASGDARTLAKYKMKCKVVPFRIELYESVFKLWESCEGIGLGESDSKDNIKIFLERNPGLSFVAVKDNEVIGAVLSGHDGRRGYIHHLAVVKKERKEGVGKLLVNSCLSSLKRLGIVKCHIFIFKTNELGKTFWESIGWKYRNDISIISNFIYKYK